MMGIPVPEGMGDYRYFFFANDHFKFDSTAWLDALKESFIEIADNVVTSHAYFHQSHECRCVRSN